MKVNKHEIGPECAICVKFTTDFLKAVSEKSCVSLFIVFVLKVATNRIKPSFSHLHDTIYLLNNINFNKGGNSRKFPRFGITPLYKTA